jgi:putative SOS response-associated peptidase YedK
MYLDHYIGMMAPDRVGTEQLELSWNVAPTDPVYAMINHDGEKVLGSFKWGLVPHWAKDRRSIQINARSETAFEKPTFRDSFKSKRCLIPADGFYEWRRDGDSKQAYYITNVSPMVFAGLWSSWKDPQTDSWLNTCTILTTDAASQIAGVHHRMPVLLPQRLWEDWIDPEEQEVANLRGVLEEVADSGYSITEVSSLVNSVRNNGPELVSPQR